MSEDGLKENSLTIIKKMMELSEKTQEDTSMLVDEILHSIFFLEVINDTKFSPNNIVRDEKMLNELKTRFPNPFDHYSSRLPKRSPISCVLDMIVRLIGQENENQIIKMLQDVIRPKSGDNNSKKKRFTSSTICVSQKTEGPDSARYYGVSMSTSGRHPGRIMVAASCLSAWDSHVADAVMTYCPGTTKKSYFDGTIQLPESVRCQAFSLSTGDEMPPCRSCGNLFGLYKNTEDEGWAYGNCAEVESLSNLLKNENEVKKQVQPTSQMCKDENRQKAKKETKDHLLDLLQKVKFKTGLEFYTPQRGLPLRNGGNV
ncbi:uncharacterized protein LOC130184055 [Seriola aureovittata]|uniref:uncharacterized protein LOC130184055 n=1 Tax=Seriola aureovittata TaxID=2871759 RepID=UPI0024BDCA20|nr:uncharacterized protein LOC130184055 [Seriola aureovittata]